MFNLNFTIMKKKDLKKMNDMGVIDKLTNVEVNQIKGGKLKVEGNLGLKISNLKWRQDEV